MNARILVSPSEIAEYFENNCCLLACEYKTIAQNLDYGVVIYLSNTNGRPTITVMADDDERAEVTTNVEGLEALAQSMYETYLSVNAIDVLSSDEEEAEEGYDDEMTEEDLNIMAIDDRETELDAAVDDFLSIIMQSHGVENDVIDEIHDDVKEHFCEYLYRKHKLEIYRPMYLEDEDGEEFYEEYPYDCLEFEDETNPIYM